MSIKPHEAEIIAALVMKEIRAQGITASSDPAYLGVWPVAASAGPRALGAIIRPEKNCYMSMDAVPNTLGSGSPHCAYLAADTDYVFPIHPQVNTFGFLDAESQSDNAVRVTWVLS